MAAGLGLKHRILFILPALLFFSGCAHTVEYDLTAKDRIASRKINKIVEVKKFEDKIPPGQPHVVRIDGKKWRTNAERGYTEADLAYSLTGMVARHLEQSGLFKDVIYKGGFEDSDSPPSDAQYVLTGVISEYSVMGKVNTAAETKAMVAGVFGTPGRIAGALANLDEETEIRVKITLKDVTLKDVKSGRILWKDTVTGTRQFNDDFEAAAAGPIYDPADFSLKPVVSELIRRMKIKLEHPAAAPAASKAKTTKSKHR